MAENKKVIIISYFFPPCNLTGGKRAFGWATELHQEGIYPIVITRSWDHEIKEFLDMSRKSGTENLIDKHDNYEIHYLKHTGSLKDKFVQRLGSKLSPIRKVLSMGELLFQNIHIRFSPYKNFYFKAKELLKQHPNIESVIISGSPFQQFYIGYKLKKKFPNIKWIADYRDEWTSRPNFENERSREFFLRYDRRFERKWLSNADHFTYVNDAYIKRIAEVTNHKGGKVIMNGYKEIENFIHAPKKGQLVLSFPGTLYGHQNVEFFANAISLFRERHPEIPVEINFIGSGINVGVKEKIETAFGNMLDCVNITPRMPQNEVLENYLSKSHAILMFPIKNMNMIVPTKIIANLPLGVPFVFAPSDNGAIDRLIRDTDIGISTNDQEELVEYLYQLSSNNSINQNFNSPQITKYSRNEQIRNLAKILISK